MNLAKNIIIFLFAVLLVWVGWYIRGKYEDVKDFIF